MWGELQRSIIWDDQWEECLHFTWRKKLTRGTNHLNRILKFHCVSSIRIRKGWEKNTFRCNSHRWRHRCIANDDTQMITWQKIWLDKQPHFSNSLCNQHACKVPYHIPGREAEVHLQWWHHMTNSSSILFQARRGARCSWCLSHHILASENTRIFASNPGVVRRRRQRCISNDNHIFCNLPK